MTGSAVFFKNNSPKAVSTQSPQLPFTFCVPNRRTAPSKYQSWSPISAT